MRDGQQIEALAGLPLSGRIRGYLRLTGPGYLQSAMTLGGGTVASCVVMGSTFGYDLLWVQPLAILLGFSVLSAIARQTCATGERPYDAFWRRLSPILALAWGISSLAATVIWHIPQYSLTANGVVTLAGGVGVDLDGAYARAGVGAVVLLCGLGLVALYNRGARGLKWYELSIKVLVWLIVLAFAIVAFTSGIQWGRLAAGFLGISFLKQVFAGTVSPDVVPPIVAGLAAAVGINMIFLYPYSLLNKKWGRQHEELAYFDLLTGMVAPFLISTTFLIVGTANVIGPPPGEVGESVQDIRDVATALAPTFGEGLSLLLVGLGMFAVGFSTIATHMVASGFIGCEVFGFSHEGRARFWFSLMPAVGVIGVAIRFPWYAAITASTLAAPLMPLAVLCFLILLNRPSYMGDRLPRGVARWAWNTALIASIVVMTIASYFSLRSNWATLMEQLQPRAAEAAVTQVGSDEAAETGSVQVSRRGMGTEFTFVLHGEPSGHDAGLLEQIANEALDAVEDIEARLSTWREGSQTNYVNRHAASGAVRVAPDLFALLALSVQLHEETQGAFDITVGPLVDLWRVCKNDGRLPSADEVSRARAAMGVEDIALDPDARTVAFNRPGLRLDLDGLLKGYALDQAAEIIRGYGVTSALLNAGASTMTAIGAPPGRPGWTVKVRSPYNADAYIAEMLVEDASLSTSGSDRAPITIEGVTFNHIFDPRTGAPVTETAVAGAIAPTGAQSDALSTAFFVLGAEGARAYCQAHREVRAFLVAADAETPEIEYINFQTHEPKG